MSLRGPCAVLLVSLGIASTASAWGQAPASTAKVDVAPLELVDPDRYQIPGLLEAVRHVSIVATTDAVVRSQDAKAGATVRENQDVLQLDRGEASARLKIAQAEAREAQAEAAAAKAGAARSGLSAEVAQARLEAAQARVELAQIAFDRCTLRAPFAGRVLTSAVSDGQYVAKGTILAELADVSSLKVLLPVRRAGATVGGSLALTVEGQPASGKIQALVPLPESLAVLRELASPFTAAWVLIPNTSGALEPGERALSPDLPVAPLANVPTPALKADDSKSKTFEAGTAATLQVIRNEYVADVKVRVVGRLGPERVQVTGPLRPTDALITATSVPLIAGTLVRFNGSGVSRVESTTPDPSVSGATADLTPPRASRPPSSSRSGPVPIGAPGSAAPKVRSAPAPANDTSKPAAKAGGNVPF
jgi:multidrug efflux pump subunit AcrA (membrane-fusion protein)